MLEIIEKDRNNFGRKIIENKRSIIDSFLAI